MNLSETLRSIQDRINAACLRAGRDPGTVSLMAVTKGQPPETVAQAVSEGITLFGENKIQEAKAKIPMSPARARWHFIGHLQTNKCRDAVELFTMVQSVDSLRLAEELNARAEQASRPLAILLEVNVAGEASKFGYRPEALLAELPALNRLPRLELHGLMAIPPWSPEPEKVRPLFREVADLRKKAEQIIGAPLGQLSMGMSGDFEVAIEEGSTMVRIGTALFGPRPRVARGTTPEGG